MDSTLNATQNEVSQKLQKNISDRTISKEEKILIGAEIDVLKEEQRVVNSEIEDLEKKLSTLNAKKAGIDFSIAEKEKRYFELVQIETGKTENETFFSEQQEILQGTRTLILSGISDLSQLDNSTSQRCLNLIFVYGSFLRQYIQYIRDLVQYYENNSEKMERRIKKQNGTIPEISELHLKLESAKVKDLIQDYQRNRERFERKKLKFHSMIDKALLDYQEAQQVISMFGRELPSL